MYIWLWLWLYVSPDSSSRSKSFCLNRDLPTRSWYHWVVTATVGRPIYETPPLQVNRGWITLSVWLCSWLKVTVVGTKQVMIEDYKVDCCFLRLVDNWFYTRDATMLKAQSLVFRVSSRSWNIEVTVFAVSDWRAERTEDWIDIISVWRRTTAVTGTAESGYVFGSFENLAKAIMQ